MKILSWLKKREKQEDAEGLQRAQEEYFDTPGEQQIESGDMEGLQADRRAGLLGREELPEAGGSADPEERLAEEEER
jgi:hypothetical protein